MSGLDMDLGLGRGLSFYRRQKANFKVLNARTTLGSFLGNLTAPYDQVYAKELGASPVELGFLSSVGSAFAAAFALPGGFLADRCGRKKLFLIGSAVGLLTPIAYFLAGNWIWLVPAYIFSNVMIALREPAYQAMYASSVKPDDRGIAFGVGTTLTSLPVMLAPIAAVELMGHPAMITAGEIRPLYLLQLMGLGALWIFILVLLTEEGRNWVGLRSAFGAKDLLFLCPFIAVPPAACLIMGFAEGIEVGGLMPLMLMAGVPVLLLVAWHRSRSSEPTQGSLRQDVGKMLSLPGVKAWLAMKGTGAAALGLASPFWLVYAAYVIGVSPAGLALMVSLRTVGQLVSALPWGIAADRRGRKFTLLFGRSFMHIGILCFIFSRNPWVLIFGYALMGVADGSASVWTVIRMELVPSESRSAMASMDAFVWYLPVIFAALVGGIIYSFWTKLIFIMCLAIDVGIRMPLVAFGVPETSKRLRANAGASVP